MSNRWYSVREVNPQIWIEGKEESDELLVIFDQCIFNNNRGPNKGGALNYGKSKHMSNSRVEFHECEFNENEASESGGALCLIIYQ